MKQRKRSQSQSSRTCNFRVNWHERILSTPRVGKIECLIPVHWLLMVNLASIIPYCQDGRVNFFNGLEPITGQFDIDLREYTIIYDGYFPLRLVLH